MRSHYLSLLLAVPGLAPGVGSAQAVPRTDTPRAGTLRVTFDPVVSAWDNEFTPAGKRPIGASLPAPVFVHAERRVTPLTVEMGLTSRIALSVRLPLVRTMIRAGHSPDSTADSAKAVLDSLLADTTYAYSPIENTRHGLRYFTGDAELAAKLRLGSSAGPYAAAAQILVRLPTGHLDSPNDLFDLSTGDHQSDVELSVIQELTVAGHVWLNLSVRAAQQRPGKRERRVAPQDSLFVPHAATALLDWNPGDYVAVDCAPLYRFNPYFAAGVTVGYFTKGRDRYSFASSADSVALATRLGSPRSASVLDGGTSERRLRLGVAVTYLGRDLEGGLAFEQTVSGVGGRLPVTSVFRIVLRFSRWPF
jgi:hypothetical protein